MYQPPSSLLQHVKQKCTGCKENSEQKLYKLKLLFPFVPPTLLLYIDGIMPEGRMCRNEISLQCNSKFFDCFAVCYYHVFVKLPEIKNAAQHEKHAVFDATIHFPRFSLILTLQFIHTFGIGVYTLLSSTTYEQSI